MAKGKILDFQLHLKTDESFQQVLTDEENLWVVDVYTEWCGHCTCAVGTFQKANIKFSGKPIKFATASSDTIPFLAKYTGTSQPTFMFLAGKGTIVDVIRGVNVPLINEKMGKYLELEAKIKNGEAERVEFYDKVVATPAPEEPDEEEEEEAEETVELRPLTVALIKPDAVADGKADDILAKLDDCGIDVVGKIETTLSREDAQTFYSQHQGTDFFLQLIDYMTSGPIIALALAAKKKGTDVVAQWRTLIGPKDVTIAKEEAPESLRAQFGSKDEEFKNALHGSDTSEHAARELAFFFPDFHKKRQATQPKTTRVQRTLALIRPDALRKYKDDILGKIHSSGFEIANAKEVSLTKEQAAEFYKEHADQDYFEKLVTHMSSGPVMALALCREDAVSGWREMLGPKNVEEAQDIAPDRYLRAQFVEDEEDPALNALHGSDSLESAEREVNFFFPKQQTLAVIKPDTSSEERDEILQKIRASGFHIQAQKETHLTKDVVEQFYSEHKDKEFFGELTEFMTSGPTMFMVLSREDAIDGMRDMMGPADPEEAKKVAPESIRAKLGKNVLKNSIHAALDEERAKAEIRLAFGDELEFDEEGKVKESPENAPDDAEIEGAAHNDDAAEGGEAEPAPAEPAVTGRVSQALPIIIETAEEESTESEIDQPKNDAEETGVEKEEENSQDNAESGKVEATLGEEETVPETTETNEKGSEDTRPTGEASVSQEEEERVVSEETRRFLEEIAKEAEEEAKAASKEGKTVDNEEKETEKPSEEPTHSGEGESAPAAEA
ncbi:hypothetical protein ACHWQZ_G007121 [Mnemiopsis leidyi]